MLTTGADGQPLSYEGVLRPQFTAMGANSKGHFQKAATSQQQAQAEQFLESEDWQALLQQKFKA